MESSKIELHLAECQDCEKTVVGLEQEPDTIVELLRVGSSRATQAVPDEPPAPSVFVRAFENAKELMDADDAPPRLIAWTPPPGDFGAYELLKPLGRGGMAAVYLARHRQLGKLVAIKMLPAPSEVEQESAARFQREIRATGCLNHPAIVLATDAGERDGLQYLVMEYVDGLDLSRLARAQGPLRIADACELARQVALGLSHAHAAGIVHRDIKPSNLMLDTAGRAKILDFGLAQLSLWDEASAELTTVGQLMGTLDYMAPEQAERSSSVDYRADLYALGSTLFRLLCGRAPLAATPNLSPLEKLRLLANQQPPKLDTLRPDAPRELVQLNSSLLARDPESRPASAAHVAEQLAPFTAGSDLGGLIERAKAALQSPDKSAQRVAVMPQPLAVSSLDSSDRRPPSNRLRRWLIAAACIPLLAVAGVLIVLETQKGQLVIESEVADVQVKVLQDGQTQREFTLLPGATTTRLYAGQYEVTLASPSDSITLDNDKFNIRNGETVVARVQRKPVTEKIDVASTNPTLPADTSSELMYEGKPLSGWLEQLKRDRSPEAIGQSFVAIRALAGPETATQITDTLISILPSLDGTASLYRPHPSGVPFSTGSINVEVFSILASCHPGKRFEELLTRLLESKEPKLKILGLNRANWSFYSTAEPVLRWLETHFKSADIESPESDELRAAAVRCLKDCAQPNPSSYPDSIKLAAQALRLLKQGAFVGPEFWLMEPFPNRLDDWYVDYRQEVLRRSVAVIEDTNSSRQHVAHAAVILSSHPMYGLDEVSDEVCKSLVSALETRLKNLSTDPKRLLGLTNLPALFGEHRRWIPPMYIGMLEVLFLNDSSNGREELPVSETFELLKFCRVLVDDNRAYRPNVEPAKLIMATTESHFSRIRGRFKPLPFMQKAQVSWPSLRTLAVDQLSENDPVFAKALNLTPQDWMGCVIHIRAAELAGVTLEGSSSNQATSQQPAPPIVAASLPQANSNSKPIEATYEGKPLADWLSVVKNDRSQATVSEALRAVGALVADENAAVITQVILEILRSSNPDVWQASIRSQATSSSQATSVTLDSIAVGVLAKANPGDKFGEVVVQELDVNNETRTRRLLLALKSATVKKQLNPILNWLASSPIPQTYSEAVLEPLGSFLEKILTGSDTTLDTKRTARSSIQSRWLVLRIIRLPTAEHSGKSETERSAGQAYGISNTVSRVRSVG